jgi:hypothetical protein
MSLLLPYEYFAAENALSLIALGTTIGFILLLTFAASARRKVFRQQKRLERLEQDVAALRLAEEKRFLKDLNRLNTTALRPQPAFSKAQK